MFERRYAPFITQVMLGGVDSKPSIYVLDPLGSVIPDDYSAVGSGAEIAIGILESGFSPSLTEKQAKDLATKAIRGGVSRDAASGDGIDLIIASKGGLKEESVDFEK
jgi:proteasome beta subunit